jgi:two-component system cell cycle sensor histidine kinase/response regulator CckA
MTDPAERILIVDDEPSLLKMMSIFLSRIGFSVSVAGSAVKARAELAAAPHPFAVVVLDASMPGATLGELGREILAADSEVRLIAASGYPIDMSGLEAAAPGRVAFLHKPFSPEMLAATVRRMLGTQEKSV